MADDTKDFRAAVHTEVLAWRAAHAPTADVIYENGPVPDEAAITSPWVDVEVRYYGAHEVTVGVRARGRHSGSVSIAVYSRAGTGTGTSDGIVDSLQEHFRSRRVGAGLLRFPQRVMPSTLKGWYKTGILIPFTLDSP